jgi:hypothetical protein
MTFIATVKTYDQGLKNSLGYEIPHQDGVNTFQSRENSLEQIHFVVVGNHVVVSDDEDLELYKNNPDRVKADGEEILEGEVTLTM